MFEWRHPTKIKQNLLQATKRKIKFKPKHKRKTFEIFQTKRNNKVNKNKYNIKNRVKKTEMIVTS